MAGRRTRDPLEAIDWGTEVTDSRIGVYFASGGFGDSTWPWFREDRATAMQALETFSDVADVSFFRTGSIDRAGYVLTLQDLDRDTSGWMNPPGEQLAGLAAFNDDVKVPGVPTGPGSFAFKVLVHEFGHGLGLAHPHDTGGTSRILAGVTSEEGSYGIGALNQGVYTAMSYNDGWVAGPLGGTPSDRFGYEATPMALDVAILQAKYGANLDHATGDDVYRLPGANRAGTSYACIWDAAGSDRIIFGDDNDCVIDLRPATLRGEVGGGGWLSHAAGIHGGFTIAKGVMIERAIGGSGDDTLRGNGADNVISGRAGADRLIGGGGNDHLIGGRGADVFVVGERSGEDWIADFRPGTDLVRIRSGAEEFGDLALSRARGGTLVEFADASLTLAGLRPASIDAHDFLFA